jgi:hypothetical protein
MKILPIFMQIKRTLAIGILVLISGCVVAVEGKQNGNYISPHGNFTVPYPQMGAGMRVQKQSFESSGFVSFHDDFGNLISIEYSLLPPSAGAMFATAEKTDATYAGLVKNVALPEMRAQAPNTEMLYQESVDIDGGRGYFFVLDMPESSTLVDLKTGKRMDSTRGFMYFYSGGYVYRLSAQYGSLSGLLFGKEPGEESIEKSFIELLDKLKRFKETMELM